MKFLGQAFVVEHLQEGLPEGLRVVCRCEIILLAQVILNLSTRRYLVEDIFLESGAVVEHSTFRVEEAVGERLGVLIELWEALL